MIRTLLSERRAAVRLGCSVMLLALVLAPVMAFVLKESQVFREARAAAERIRARAATLGAGFDWEALKRDRDEGRP